MSGWVLWLIAAAAFGIGEMLTTSFFLAPFAVGATLAAVTDVAGAGELAIVDRVRRRVAADAADRPADRQVPPEDAAADPDRAAPR